MFRSNSQRTGSSDTIGVIQFHEVKWKVKKSCGIYLESSPIIIDNVLYLFTPSGYLEAFETQNGQKLWELLLEPGLASQITFQGKTIYVAGDDGYIAAVDIQAQHLIWRSKTGNARNFDPAITDGDGVICVSDKDGCLYGLAQETGEQMWTFHPAKDMNMSSPSTSHGMAYVASCNGNLYAVDVLTGHQRWQAEIGLCDQNTVPVIHRGFIYIATKKGNLYQLDAESGQIAKQMKVGEEKLSSPLSLAINDQIIYIQSFGGSFSAIDLQSGQELWKKHSRQYLFINNFVVSNDGLYSGSAGAVHALDLQTGRELWKFIAPTPKIWILQPKMWLSLLVTLVSKIATGVPMTRVFGCPVVFNGTIYVLCNDGYLYALH
jgi:outer membrane protein assembly factor BamB